jgi:hypothetical protein
MIKHIVLREHLAKKMLFDPNPSLFAAPNDVMDNLIPFMGDPRSNDLNFRF